MQPVIFMRGALDHEVRVSVATNTPDTRSRNLY